MSARGINPRVLVTDERERPLFNVTILMVGQEPEGRILQKALSNAIGIATFDTVTTDTEYLFRPEGFRNQAGNQFLRLLRGKLDRRRAVSRDLQAVSMRAAIHKLLKVLFPKQHKWLRVYKGGQISFRCLCGYKPR